MPRKKISEFRAKTILYSALGLPYDGLAIDAAAEVWHDDVKQLPVAKHYVVKVDEGIKGRYKKGLVLLDRTVSQLDGDIDALAKKGFRYALIEPYQDHAQESEYYLAIERTRAGNIVSFSKLGGVDVESNATAMKHEHLEPSSADRIAQEIGLPAETLECLNDAFNRNYFSFLEINPFVVDESEVQFLDAAVEVDDEAAPLVNHAWVQADIREDSARTPEELAVEELGARSQASFRLKVLNEDGAVFLLLSGGGASIVVADEVALRGYGAELANYGEYSGNPNEEETYLYTKQVVSLMLRSSAEHKVLIISGGVANFTDIRVTFRGVVRALDEKSDELRKQGILVFVRRGGPFEAEGLKAITKFLNDKGLLGLVSGPEMTLSDIVPAALAKLEN